MYLLDKNHDGHVIIKLNTYVMTKIENRYFQGIFQERCVPITAIPIELRN